MSGRKSGVSFLKDSLLQQPVEDDARVFRRHRPDELAANPPFAVQEELLRDARDAELHRDQPLIVADGRVRDAERLVELTQLVRVVPQADADEDDASLVLAIDLREYRRLLPAGGAPGGVEVDHRHLAGQRRRGERALLAYQRQLEVGDDSQFHPPLAEPAEARPAGAAG